MRSTSSTGTAADAATSAAPHGRSTRTTTTGSDASRMAPESCPFPTTARRSAPRAHRSRGRSPRPGPLRPSGMLAIDQQAWCAAWNTSGHFAAVDDTLGGAMADRRPSPGEITIMASGAVAFIFSFFDFYDYGGFGGGGADAWSSGLFTGRDPDGDLRHCDGRSGRTHGSRTSACPIGLRGSPGTRSTSCSGSSRRCMRSRFSS